MSGGGDDFPVKIIFFLSSCLMMGALFRHLRKISVIPQSPQFCLLIVGFLLGGFLKSIENNYPQNKTSLLEDPFGIDKATDNCYLYMAAVMPLLVFDTTFNTKIAFIKDEFPGILFIVIPNYSLILVLYYYMCRTTIYGVEFEFEHYVMIVSALVFQSYREVRSFFTDHDVDVAIVSATQVEIVLNILISFLFFTFGLLIKTYTRTNKEIPYLYVINSLVLSVCVGLLAASIVVFWTNKIMHDHANSTAIILTFIYAAYNLWGNVDICGPLCVWVMGLRLASKTETMSSTLLIQFNKLIEVVLLMLSCTVCAMGGLELMDVIYCGNIKAEDYIGVLALFFITIIIRIVVIFTVRFSIRSMCVNHSWPKLSTIITATANFRGSSSILFCLTFLDVFKHQAVLRDKIFFATMGNIVLSFILDRFLCGFFVELSNRFNYHIRDKCLQLERAVLDLIEIKNYSFDTLRNDAFIADADWDIVYEHTLLQQDILRDNINIKIINLIKRGITFRISACAEEMVTRRINHTAKDVKDSSKQMGNIEREIYRQLYLNNQLSKKAYTYMNHMADKEARTARLIRSQDLISVTEPSKRLLWLYGCIKRSFSGPRTNMKAKFFLYTGLCMVDLTFVMISFREQFFDSGSPWCTVYRWYLTVVLGMFFILLLGQMIRQKSCHISQYYIQTFLSVIIVLLTGLDLAVYFLFEKYGSEISAEVQKNDLYKIEMCIFLLLLVATRFIRLFKMLEVSQKLEGMILSIVIKAMERELFFACDVVHAFLVASRYSNKNIATIVKDPEVALHLRQIGHLQRLQMKQYLGVISVKNLGVATSFKTRLLVKKTLNSMMSRLDEIEHSGLISDVDSASIRSSISNALLSTKKMATYMTPLSTQDLIINIPWVDGDMELTSFIMTHGKVLLYSPRDVIATQGHMPQGVFIILLGLVRIEQTINKDVQGEARHTEESRKTSTVVYHVDKEERGEILQGFLGRGGVIGLQALLTGRPGHKTFRCATHVEVLVVNMPCMERKVKVSPPNQEMSKIERRMWHATAVIQSVVIMQRDTTSHGLSRNKFMDQMCNAFLIDGFNNKTIDINWSETAAVVLIRGYVMNFFTLEQHVGPCLIPDYCLRLVCKPEKGMRVILLMVKKGDYEDHTSPEFPHYEEMLAESDADQVTLSSNTSIGGPMLMTRPYYKDVKDLSVKFNQKDFMDCECHSSNRSLSEVDDIDSCKTSVRANHSDISMISKKLGSPSRLLHTASSRQMYGKNSTGTEATRLNLSQHSSPGSKGPDEETSLASKTSSNTKDSEDTKDTKDSCFNCSKGGKNNKDKAKRQ